MIADLSQLHENTHNAKEITVSEDILCFIMINVFIIEQSLPSRKIALDDVLYFLWQLLFDISLHSSKKEWPKNGLQLLDDSEI